MPQEIDQPKVFLDPYPNVGRLKTDRHMLPHYNSSETLTILPGELILKPHRGLFWVCMAQSPILPGTVKDVLLNWNGIFPCNFSAPVMDGDEVWWDPEEGDHGAMVLEADAGDAAFPAGAATFSIDPAGKPVLTNPPAADGIPVVADENSTSVQVVSISEPIEGPGS